MNDDKIQSIAAAWASYQLMVLPSNASLTQIEETRKAFYGGAAGMISLLFEGDQLNEERFMEIYNELAQFGAENSLKHYGGKLN